MYQVRAIDLTDLHQQKQVNDLLNDTFDLGVKANDIWLNTHTISELGKALYLGAFWDDELVGFNAYIAHDLLQGRKRYLAYQSCWSAVSTAHRKQGLFIQLQEAARTPLKARGAIGIIGLPNDRSGPILTGPLGYENKGEFIRSIFVLPARQTYKKHSFSQLSSDSLTPDNHHLFSLKMQQPSREILSAKDQHDNIVWGKFTRVKKLGFSFRHFLVGGLEVPNPEHFSSLIAYFSHQHSIQLMTFVYHPSSDYASLFRYNAPSNSGYLCWYPLNERFRDWQKFNFWVGLSDVF